jgi:hypothetical protein
MRAPSVVESPAEAAESTANRATEIIELRGMLIVLQDETGLTKN